MVPHSHMDAGWLFTIDDYYSQGVQHILTSVVSELGNNPTYRYTIGDIFFLKMWYTQ
jgi:hypothetical protein